MEQTYDPLFIIGTAALFAIFIIAIGEWWNKKAFGRTMWPRKRDGSRS